MDTGKKEEKVKPIGIILGGKMDYNKKNEFNSEKKPEAAVCEGCQKWNWHGEKCWVYWQNKKVCSHFEDEFGSNKKGFRLAKDDDEFRL